MAAWRMMITPRCVVPVPDSLLEVVDLVYGVRDTRARRDGGRKHRLWLWSRMTGWRRVIEVMVRADITGPHATPKGLRHGFGVAAVSAGIPLNLIQKWLGHAQLSTTAVYADAMGAEERDIARRLWGDGLSGGAHLRKEVGTVSSAHLRS